MKTAFEILQDHLDLPKEITVDDIDGTIIGKVHLSNIVEAMEYYAKIKIDEYKESIKPKKNIWGKPLDDGGIDFTRNAGQRDN